MICTQKQKNKKEEVVFMQEKKATIPQKLVRSFWAENHNLTISSAFQTFSLFEHKAAQILQKIKYQLSGLSYLNLAAFKP